MGAEKIEGKRGGCKRTGSEYRILQPPLIPYPASHRRTETHTHTPNSSITAQQEREQIVCCTNRQTRAAGTSECWISERCVPPPSPPSSSNLCPSLSACSPCLFRLYDLLLRQSQREPARSMPGESALRSIPAEKQAEHEETGLPGPGRTSVTGVKVACLGYV